MCERNMVHTVAVIATHHMFQLPYCVVGFRWRENIYNCKICYSCLKEFKVICIDMFIVYHVTFFHSVQYKSFCS